MGSVYFNRPRKVPKNLDFTGFFLLEISVEQTLQGFSVSSLVAGHLVDGVVNGIQAVLLGADGQIGLYWEKAAWEEAEHAAKFAELLGEVVTASTKKNLEMRVEAENGATAGKFDLAKRAKALNLDAIHDTVHEMARDEARHGKAFEGLLARYFG